MIWLSIITLATIGLYFASQDTVLSWHNPHPNFFPPPPVKLPTILETEAHHEIRLKKYGFSWASVHRGEDDYNSARGPIPPTIDPPVNYCWSGGWQDAGIYWQRKLLRYED